MKLTKNQSAIILTLDEDGEITVDVASGDQKGITASICGAIAQKLMGDEEFQEEIMDIIEGDE